VVGGGIGDGCELFELEDVAPQLDSKQRKNSKNNADKDGVFIVNASFYIGSASE